MKKYLFILFAAVAVSHFSACEKWLDVQPANTVTEDELFKTGNGYRNALNGIYQLMSSSSLFGRELTWGMTEVLAHTYEHKLFTALSPYSSLAVYDYRDESVKALIQSLWSMAYKAVANCNELIQNVESAPASQFKGGELEKNMILGEALALRGFLHLEILTYFAPAPVKESTETWIPYADRFPSIVPEKQTVDEILGRIVGDLKRAQPLVEAFDTYVSDNGREDHRIWLSHDYRFFINTNTGATNDIFYAFRGYRMNYLAVTAILARAYSYSGEHALAATEAQKVIDYKYNPDYPDTAISFTEENEARSNYKLSFDLIFCLSDRELTTNYTNYQIGGVKLPNLSQEFYPGIFDSASDYRMKILTFINGTSLCPRRYFTPDKIGDYTSQLTDMLPVIRLSEMYYILAEDFAAQGLYADATINLEKVRAARGCVADQLNGKITDDTSFRAELLKEVRREFAEEGRIFSYYKKYDTKLSPMTDESFVFPLPDNENIN